MEVGLTEDGLGNGSAFSVASYAIGNVFASKYYPQPTTKQIQSPLIVCFLYVGLPILLVVLYGVSQYDICWYTCADYSGNVAMFGLAGFLAS